MENFSECFNECKINNMSLKELNSLKESINNELNNRLLNKHNQEFTSKIKKNEKMEHECHNYLKFISLLDIKLIKYRTEKFLIKPETTNKSFFYDIYILLTVDKIEIKCELTKIINPEDKKKDLFLTYVEGININDLDNLLNVYYKHYEIFDTKYKEIYIFSDFTFELFIEMIKSVINKWFEILHI